MAGSQQKKIQDLKEYNNILKLQTLVGYQNVQAQIRLFLKKQSDQGLPHLLFWQHELRKRDKM